MELVKTSLLNSVAVVIKLATLFGINKILAIYVGPSGYALLGQFQNVIQIVTTFASGAINTGVTKYTAEYSEAPEKQQKLWAVAGTISLIGSLLTIVGIIIFKKEIAIWLLHDESYQSVFIWFSIGLVFFVFNSLLLAILNGKSEIRLYVIANIVGSIISFIVTCSLAINMGLWGALVALSIYQSGAFFSTLLLYRKVTWFKIRFLFGSVDRATLKNLSKYTLMAVTSALCGPIANILVRDHLIINFGTDLAGYWEAITRLSSAYLLLFTSVLSVYYLPKYARLKNPKELKQEVFNGYKIILPIVILFCCAIYFLRDFIITLLFTKDFLPMRELFLWYQFGDFLKMGSWLLAFIMLGRTMVKSFIMTEIIFSISFVSLTFLLTGYYGLEGSAMAYAANYLLYWPVLYIIMSCTVFRSDTKEIIAAED